MPSLGLSRNMVAKPWPHQHACCSRSYQEDLLLAERNSLPVKPAIDFYYFRDLEKKSPADFVNQQGT